MSTLSPQWQIQTPAEVPDTFIELVGQLAPGLPPDYQAKFAAQLLWQRGICSDAQLQGFLNPQAYESASPFDFDPEMTWAVERLQRAYEEQTPVAIWGDFDADGLTATAVLWEGLSQFFALPNQLTYFIPNRLTESHGLSCRGLGQLAQQGYGLVVTCDTGSTNLAEIDYAHTLGLEVIITDHHTLPSDRPPVTAIINPRSLDAQHPLAHLSGVAVAYKLIEALYQTLPDSPQRPLSELLDLVAIGLIADLVELTGDCRYLAQVGIEQLQCRVQDQGSGRPGIARLLELCKRSGDRPTDISFGLGPRINAVSRIHGDASFCVELLTSRDRAHCYRLAEAAELANSRRKALQREVLQQVQQRLVQMDLSTTQVIVLADPQWPVGILGLVAGQVAQTYGRPTILLTTEPAAPMSDALSGASEGRADRESEGLVGDPLSNRAATNPDNPTDDNSTAEDVTAPLARGSARSVNRIDLYELVQDQAHLLHRFGGHPFAAGLSLAAENIPLFAAAINQKFRIQHPGGIQHPVLSADLVVTVADLQSKINPEGKPGQRLFRELKLLEPCGMGNPVPKLLIRNCWFEQVRNRNIQDLRGKKVRYIKTEFWMRDESAQTGFPGIWWEHYTEELPQGRCDAIAELDFNTYRQGRYEIRLLDLRPHEPTGNLTTLISSVHESVDWLIDHRGLSPEDRAQRSLPEGAQVLTQSPGSWDEFRTACRQAYQSHRSLVLAYDSPPDLVPLQQWQQLVGLAKYLSRTGQSTTCEQLQKKLGLGPRSLQIGLTVLSQTGFQIQHHPTLRIIQNHASNCPDSASTASAPLQTGIAQFVAGVDAEQFQRQYFYTLPLEHLQQAASQCVEPNSVHQVQ